MGSSLRICLSMFVKGHFVLLSGQCGNQIGAKVICFSISFFSLVQMSCFKINLFQNAGNNARVRESPYESVCMYK